ncbi:MAG: response regulator [Promethearchaeota archaeon]
MIIDNWDTHGLVLIKRFSLEISSKIENSEALVSIMLKKRKKVLVVDDDSGMTETISDILEDSGFRVSYSNDGYHAIEMIRNNDFDAVILDLRMPNINGLDALIKIKKIKPKTNVLIMTAYAMDARESEIFEAGAKAILYKPLNIPKTIAILNKICNLKDN